MNKAALTFVSLLILLLIALNIDNITDSLTNLLNSNKDIVILDANEYQRDYEYILLENSEDFIPYSYNTLLDIYYSFLNNGWDTFTFYCPIEYLTCIEDVKKISEDNSLLTHISNYVHPFNSFDEINTIYDNSGEVTLKRSLLYTSGEIRKIEEEVDELLEELITDNMDINEKVLKIHDYIINNTRYDKEKNETGTSNYKSNIAFGPLFEGYAICGGYADLMAIFLTELDIPNYKIASETHVWNAVYINDEWVHLDLTWDDPVDDTGKDYLNHKYFLVNNNTLIKEDGEYAEHDFNKMIYLEFNY